jgi:hypothetical protein
MKNTDTRHHTHHHRPCTGRRDQPLHTALLLLRSWVIRNPKAKQTRSLINLPRENQYSNAYYYAQAPALNLSAHPSQSKAWEPESSSSSSSCCCPQPSCHLVMLLFGFLSISSCCCCCFSQNTNIPKSRVIPASQQQQRASHGATSVKASASPAP